MNKYAENSKTRAAGMARATFGRKTVSDESRKVIIDRIRIREMDNEIEEAEQRREKYADWEF